MFAEFIICCIKLTLGVHHLCLRATRSPSVALIGAGCSRHSPSADLKWALGVCTSCRVWARSCLKSAQGYTRNYRHSEPAPVKEFRTLQEPGLRPVKRSKRCSSSAAIKLALGVHCGVDQLPTGRRTTSTRCLSARRASLQLSASVGGSAAYAICCLFGAGRSLRSGSASYGS